MSLLTRVDGLVLLDLDLAVRGFGVEITATGPPPALWSARDAAGEVLDPLEYERYGTRHRSMFRYCAAAPGSVGFVVSQDGAVRAVTALERGVVVWEDIKVQQYEFSESDISLIERTRPGDPPVDG